MLNRRHLRIKVLQSLYAFFQSKDEGYGSVEKETLNSLERIYDLYIYFLLTFSELKTFGEYRMEENKKKIFPTDEDANPNRKFVDSAIIDILEKQPTLRVLSEQRKVNWVGDENQQMFRKIYNQLREGEVYDSYMNNEVKGFEEDKAFAIALFKAEIANSEVLYDCLEDRNIHWIDDIDLACSMVIKTIKSFEEGQEPAILDLYKDKEDETTFVRELLRKTIVLDKENELLIDELTSNWELDRIAKMDVILMKMAITELQTFNNIPTKVTLNEYIEISKFYSTPKSNSFINGVLDKAISRLVKDDKINKVGRGLKD
ncbi:MAG: transcription antitermination protein NusB [Crocinitomicaceae bacterium]|nr:transcription antitermination protein NusB [Crocinitomicaceae bacterium]MDG1777336.1 transcription antitermination protein NusB [Crocinitomicaceae bacterium]